MLFSRTVYQNKCFAATFFHVILRRGFLTNELQVSSYELRTTIYCTSNELHFTCELQVIIYCMNYVLIFTYEL